ncbi:hypothetical protein SNEBB_007157 [Seison nebaliae]|nr:hypothetical protein SNEBB_007157 [Seison nebaliae]
MNDTDDIVEYGDSMVSLPRGTSAVAERVQTAKSRVPTKSAAIGRKQNKQNNENEIPVVWAAGHLPEEYRCVSCDSHLRYPVQFGECLHRVCSACLPDLFRLNDENNCPNCDAVITRDKVYVDKPLQKEIWAIDVFCSYQQLGCDWAGTLKHLPKHLDECGFTYIQCPNACEKRFQRKDLEKHLEYDCMKRDIICEFCNETLSSKNEEDHLNKCGNFLLPCPNNCSPKEIPRSKMKNHLENECVKQEIECLFYECGCPFKGLRSQMAKHMKESPGQHLSMACKTVVAQKKMMEEQRVLIEEHRLAFDEMTKKVATMDKLFGSQFIWKIDDYEQKFQEAKSGKRSTIFSPPFLTSRHGYKLALSASLFGDGKAKGKYMSLFVCICRGDYDSLLTWPFSYRITFTLIDQSEDPASRRNMPYSIKPNICRENQPFLGRPTGERNASFGAQKFIDLDTVRMSNDYVRDDIIYVRVTIDVDE